MVYVIFSQIKINFDLPGGGIYWRCADLGVTYLYIDRWRCGRQRKAFGVVTVAYGGSGASDKMQLGDRGVIGLGETRTTDDWGAVTGMAIQESGDRYRT